MKQRWIALLIIGSLLTGAGGTYTAMAWMDGVTPAAVELETETEVPVQEPSEETTVQDSGKDGQSRTGLSINKGQLCGRGRREGS